MFPLQSDEQRAVAGPESHSFALRPGPLDRVDIVQPSLRLAIFLSHRFQRATPPRVACAHPKEDLHAVRGGTPIMFGHTPFSPPSQCAPLRLGHRTNDSRQAAPVQSRKRFDGCDRHQPNSSLEHPGAVHARTASPHCSRISVAELWAPAGTPVRVSASSNVIAIAMPRIRARSRMALVPTDGSQPPPGTPRSSSGTPNAGSSAGQHEW